MDIWDSAFGNHYQQQADIDALKRSSKSRQTARIQQRKRTDDLQKRIDVLESEVGELTLICRTLLTILRETGAVEPEQFQSVMTRIDAEDGVIDGRVTPPEPEATPYVRPTKKERKKNRIT